MIRAWKVAFDDLVIASPRPELTLHERLRLFASPHSVHGRQCWYIHSAICPTDPISTVHYRSSYHCWYSIIARPAAVPISQLVESVVSWLYTEFKSEVAPANLPVLSYSVMALQKNVAVDTALRTRRHRRVVFVSVRVTPKRRFVMKVTGIPMVQCPSSGTIWSSITSAHVVV